MKCTVLSLMLLVAMATLLLHETEAWGALANCEANCEMDVITCELFDSPDVCSQQRSTCKSNCG